MGYIEDLRKISGGELVFSLLFISGATCPGMLVIWNFSPAFVERCGAVIFILLSIALTLPVVSINALAVILPIQNHSKDVKGTDIALIGIAASSCVSILTFGIPLLIAFMGSFSLKTFVWWVIGAELVAFALCIFVGMYSTVHAR